MNSFAGSILGENDDKINWFKLEKAFSSQDAFFLFLLQTIVIRYASL